MRTQSHVCKNQYLLTYITECWEFCDDFLIQGIYTVHPYDGDMEAGRWMDLAIDN